MPAGRPRKEIDLDKVKEWVEFQATAEEIAGKLDISVDTLDLRLKDAGYDNFTDFFKKHSGTGKISLRRAQYQLAIQDKNPTMQVWLGKQYLGQKDKIEQKTEYVLNMPDHVKKL